MGIIKAVCTSPKKGMRKKNIGEGLLIKEYGLKDDAHSGPWHRQVSLLANESVNKMRAKGLDVGPGDFAENLTTEGIDLVNLPSASHSHQPGSKWRSGHDILSRSG